MKNKILELVKSNAQISIYFEELLFAGTIEKEYPELFILTQTPQEPTWHPEGNVWNHTLMCIDAAAKLIRREELDEDDALVILLGALCHDFGKPATTEFIDGRIRSLGHEEAGEMPTRSFLDKIGVDGIICEKIVNLVKNHLIPHHFYENIFDRKMKVSDSAFHRLAKRIYPATMYELALVAEADHLGIGPFLSEEDQNKTLIRVEDPAAAWFLEKWNEIKSTENIKADNAISGKKLIELGFSPGPEFKKIIEIANKLRDEEGLNKAEIIERIINMKK